MNLGACAWPPPRSSARMLPLPGPCDVTATASALPVREPQRDDVLVANVNPRVRPQTVILREGGRL
jgi:hypothetical protein